MTPLEHSSRPGRRCLWQESLGAPGCLEIQPCPIHDAPRTSEAWPTSDEGDTHTRLQTLVDESFGCVPTTPIPGLLAILEEKLPTLVRRAECGHEDADYVVQKLLFAMHIYSGYKVESRGPSGCIFDAIQRLAPSMHDQLVAGVDPGDLLDDEDAGDPRTPEFGVGAPPGSFAPRTGDAKPCTCPTSRASTPPCPQHGWQRTGELEQPVDQLDLAEAHIRAALAFTEGKLVAARRAETATNDLNAALEYIDAYRRRASEAAPLTPHERQELGELRNIAGRADDLLECLKDQWGEGAESYWDCPDVVVVALRTAVEKATAPRSAEASPDDLGDDYRNLRAALGWIEERTGEATDDMAVSIRNAAREALDAVIAPRRERGPNECSESSSGSSLVSGGDPSSQSRRSHSASSTAAAAVSAASGAGTADAAITAASSVDAPSALTSTTSSSGPSHVSGPNASAALLDLDMFPVRDGECPQHGRYGPVCVGCVEARVRREEAEKYATPSSCKAAPRRGWHETFGPVLWWRFPIVEPPYVGTPLDDDFPEYVTHWTRIDVPGGAA